MHLNVYNIQSVHQTLTKLKIELKVTRVIGICIINVLSYFVFLLVSRSQMNPYFVQNWEEATIHLIKLWSLILTTIPTHSVCASVHFYQIQTIFFHFDTEIKAWIYNCDILCLLVVCINHIIYELLIAILNFVQVLHFNFIYKLKWIEIKIYSIETIK